MHRIRKATPTSAATCSTWAMRAGKTATEVASGLTSRFNARVIPSVAYTDPEVAWLGVTEEEAKAQGHKYGKGVFP